LKRVYLSWAKKRLSIRYITGHVILGVSSRFSGEIKIVNRVDNWQDTGKTFLNYEDPDWIADDYEWVKNEDGTNITKEDTNDRRTNT